MIKSRSMYAGLCLAVAMLAIGGCENKNKTTTTTASHTASVNMGAMNDRCPLSGEPINKNAPTASYNGKTVGFCCAGCASKFNAMTDQKKAELVSKVAAK
jgi:hypothetical protein